MESIRAITLVIGPILLLAVIVWAYIRNKQSASKREIDRAERGARELRAEIAKDEEKR